jgi:hypothetical protein
LSSVMVHFTSVYGIPLTSLNFELISTDIRSPGPTGVQTES